MHKYYLTKAFSFIIFLLTGFGCSSPPLKSIQPMQRYPVILEAVAPSSYLPIQFIEILSSQLSKDFLETIETDFNSGEELIRNFPNYFSYAGKDTAVAARFIVVGEIENEAEGLAEEVDKIIKPGVNSWMQDAYSHYWAGSSRGYKAAVKYRFKILDASRNILDSLEIIGESLEPIDGANTIAALRFGPELLKCLSKKYGWPYESRLRRGTKEEIYEIKHPRSKRRDINNSEQG